MTPARFRWGMLLVLAGVLLLLRNTEVIGDGFWPETVVYLPVLLIAIGVEKIFTKSKLQFISYLTTVAFFIGGVALALDYGQRYQDDPLSNSSTFLQEHDPDIKRLRAVMDLKETVLEVRRSGDDLVFARFEDFVRRPRSYYSEHGDVGELRFVARAGSYYGGLVSIDLDDQQKWDVRFSKSLPVELECRGTDSEFHLDLSETRVTLLELDADEAEIFVRLGRLQPKIDVEIRGQNSELELVVPAASGLKVIGEQHRARLLKAGLIGVGDGYVCEGYDTAQYRIVIDLDDFSSSTLRLSYDNTI